MQFLKLMHQKMEGMLIIEASTAARNLQGWFLGFHKLTGSQDAIQCVFILGYTVHMLVELVFLGID